MGSRVWILGILALACSSENTNGLLGPSDTGGDAGTDVVADALEDVVDADALPEVSSDAADGAETPCTKVQHFNGYNTFVDCHPVGTYDEDLALVGCSAYFGVYCQVLTNPGLCNGVNLVGYKSDAWIAWTWSASTGTTRLSWTNTPECPTASDPTWW